jgi:hypothetical protein
MRRIILPLTLLASAFTLPLSAHADTIDQFTFNFDTTPGYLPLHLIVDLPASPPPSPWTVPGFGCDPVNCFAVVGESDSKSYIFFFESNFIRFALFNPPFEGPPSQVKAYTLVFPLEDLFTGSVSDPTFLTGTFDATYRPFATSPSFPGTITIEPIDTSVPEPSTFAMMATGILGAITTFRCRKPE